MPGLSFVWFKLDGIYVRQSTVSRERWERNANAGGHQRCEICMGDAVWTGWKEIWWPLALLKLHLSGPYHHSVGRGVFKLKLKLSYCRTFSI
jgi:hypothetical protein